MKLNSKYNCSLNILSKKVQVIVEDSMDELDEKDTTAIGMWMFDDHTIHLIKGLKVDVAEETLFHEIVHAVENELFIGLSEKKVSALSAVLYDTLKRNGLLKDIFEVLLSRKTVEDFPIETELSEEARIELAKTGFSLSDLAE